MWGGIPCGPIMGRTGGGYGNVPTRPGNWIEGEKHGSTGSSSHTSQGTEGDMGGNGRYNGDTRPRGIAPSDKELWPNTRFWSMVEYMRPLKN